MVAVFEEPTPSPTALLTNKSPVTVTRRGTIDELEFSTKVTIWRAAQRGLLGYRVGILRGDSMFCESLEEALRRIIYLLGLESRDLLVFDTIPGCIMGSTDDEQDHGYTADDPAA